MKKLLSKLPAYKPKYLLLACIFNGVAVFFINRAEGGFGGASISSLVQFGVSALAGFSLPFCIRHVYDRPVTRAYFYGSLVMAFWIALAGAVAHYVSLTPDYYDTVAWNFGINILAGFMVVTGKRYKRPISVAIKRLAGHQFALIYFRFWNRL